MGLTCNEEAEWRAEWRAERHETARFGGCAVVHVARRARLPETKPHVGRQTSTKHQQETTIKREAIASLAPERADVGDGAAEGFF